MNIRRLLFAFEVKPRKLLLFNGDHVYFHERQWLTFIYCDVNSRLNLSICAKRFSLDLSWEIIISPGDGIRFNSY